MTDGSIAKTSRQLVRQVISTFNLSAFDEGEPVKVT